MYSTYTSQLIRVQMFNDDTPFLILPGLLLEDDI
jgi:hypothetical protein